MASTRLVIALMAAGILFLGVLADRREEEFAAAWLFVVGLALSTLWAGLSIGWAQTHDAALSPRGFLLVTTTSLLVTIFYLYRARDLTNIAKRN